MSIITLNGNMAFRKKWPALIPFAPDVLVIQECENQIKFSAVDQVPDYNKFIWIGNIDHTGLGIFSFGDLHI